MVGSFQLSRRGGAGLADAGALAQGRGRRQAFLS